MQIQANRHQIIQGDALAVVSTLPDGAAGLVLADPPYNSGGRTATERRGRGARCKYVSSDAQHVLPDFAGESRDQRSYVAWLTLILTECLRASMDGASVLIFSDWQQLPATSDALQAAGWTWRGIIPWRKPINRPCRDGFRRECEYVLWGSNGRPYRHPESVYLPGLVEGSQPRGAKRRHITQKPVDILRQMIQICPVGGLVLDPFAGSGSAGVAAKLEGRDYVGVELTSHYAEIARERLVQPC